MQTLKVLFWNLLFIIVFCIFCFAGLEFYLRTYQTFSTETVSAVGVPIFKPDKNRTYTHKPNTVAKNGYGIPTPEIMINNVGLRNKKDFKLPSDVLLEDESHKKNLLMLGDSFTFGTGVDQDDVFANILQKRLNPNIGPLTFSPEIERGYLASSHLNLVTKSNNFVLNRVNLKPKHWQVWNAGHIGYSIGQYYLTLKNYAQKMPIDTVVVNVFVANDITELRRKNWLLNTQNDLIAVEDQKVFANKEGQLESRTTLPPKSRAWYWLKQRLQVLKYKLELDDPEFSEPTLTWPVFLAEEHPAWDSRLPKFWERFFQGMQLISDFAKEKNIKLYFVLIPMDVQVDDFYDKKYARIYFDEEALKADRPQTEIISFCAARELNCLDLLPLFRNHPKRTEIFFNYNADPHFDTLGHELTANLIYKRLKNKNN